MPLHESFHYQQDALYVDAVAVADIVREVGTPVYIYSLKRALANVERLRAAYHGLNVHVHYSAKANANLAILRALIGVGVGIDAVSAGEIYRALQAGADPAEIVFAGVGKTPAEIQYAVEQGVGWFNVENVAELAHIQAAAQALGRENIQIALRLNPEVTANTHPYIATGHGGAKFGLTAAVIQHLLTQQAAYPRLHFAGLHVHIGSQLGDTRGTVEAVEKALELITPYAQLRTLNIGGGLPVAYQDGQPLPAFQEFAEAVRPLIAGQNVQLLLEPGRSIIADAGILVGQVLYVKQQAGQTLLITDASMTELIRPALYEAVHEIIPLQRSPAALVPQQVVGPVCETADVLGRDMPLPPLHSGEHIALLTAGAYGMVMASNYNARPRPPEVVVHADGQTWAIARRRETWADLVQLER
jgi:diaminopimelate decarboxylase